MRGWDGRRLVTCEFPLTHDHQAVADAVRNEPERLTELIGASPATRLARALESFQVLPGDEDRLGSQVKPLAGALRDARSGKRCGDLLVVTAAEALWLSGVEDTAPQALRRFVSRLPDAVKRAAYAGVASGRPVGLAGDRPNPRAVERALDAARGWGHTVTVDLSSGRVTGELRRREDGHCQGSGRLATAEVTAVELWALPDGHSVWHSRGESAISNLAAIDPWEHIEDVLPASSGISPSQDLADRICLAEGEERFRAGDVDPGGLVRAPADELDGAWLNPEAVVSYSESQRARLGVVPFDPEEPLWWVLGQGAEGEPAHLPAALVFYPFLGMPGCVHASAISSNGVAAHPSRQVAIQAAWLEAVERDAFQRARLGGRANAPLRVDPDSVECGSCRALVRGLEGMGETRLVSLRSPSGAPVLMVRTDTPNQLALGMAANPDPVAALRKALLECYAHARGPFLHSVDHHTVDTPADHAALYRSPAARGAAAWMLAEGDTIGIADLPRSQPPQPPPDAVIYDFPEDGSGLSVVRVIDPRLIPLTFGYDSDPCGRPDVRDLLRDAGASADDPLYPHPFA